MSCARPRCPQAQPHRSSSFHHLPCCLSSSFSEQYGVQRNRGQLSGTKGLRVVDASVFPKIPGFFIVTSVYMIGEKAADVILANRRNYTGAAPRRAASMVALGAGVIVSVSLIVLFVRLLRRSGS